MSVVDEIKKNKELLDQGAITQEEYDKIKKDLLGLEENTVVEKKSNKTLIGIVVLVVLVIAGGIGYKLYKDSLPILTIKPMVVEVGDKVTLDISNFFDEKNSKNITVDDLTIDSELMSDDYKYNPDTKTVTNKDKKYLGVGMYEVTIKSNKVSGSTSIEVKDTTAPTITVTQKSVECELGEEMDFKSYFKVKDFSKYELKVNS